MSNEHHGHYLLLRYVIEVAFVRNVEDAVGVGDHAFPLFLR